MPARVQPFGVGGMFEAQAEIDAAVVDAVAVEVQHVVRPVGHLRALEILPQGGQRRRVEQTELTGSVIASWAKQPVSAPKRLPSSSSGMTGNACQPRFSWICSACCSSLLTHSDCNTAALTTTANGDAASIARWISGYNGAPPRSWRESIQPSCPCSASAKQSRRTKSSSGVLCERKSFIGRAKRMGG